MSQTPHPSALAPTTEIQDNASKELPQKYEGYLLKKKKWPLKGWHRRYFFLDNGFLKYAKNPHRLMKNKVHGFMDMGMSVMSTKKNALTIDLDAEDNIFHLKVKSTSLFHLWVSKLRLHRDFRLFELKDVTLIQPATGGSLEVQDSSATNTSEEFLLKEPDQSFATCNQDLTQAQNQIVLLGNMATELQASTTSFVASLQSIPHSPFPSLSKKEKERKSRKQSKKVQKSSIATSAAVSKSSSELGATSTPNFLTTDTLSQAPGAADNKYHMSRSNPDLSLLSAPSSTSLNSEDGWTKQQVAATKSVHSQSALTLPSSRSASTFSDNSTSSLTLPLSSAVAELTAKQKTFAINASNIQKSLSTIVENIKLVDEACQKKAKVVTTKKEISRLTIENNELRTRLQRIHNESSLSSHVVPAPQSVLKRRRPSKLKSGQFLSESLLSISETTSEMFYDAEEYLLSDEGSTTEEEEESEMGEDEASSDADISDGSETTSTQSLPYEVDEIADRATMIETTGRRSKLPCHKPDTDVSLWNILKKNIGKDLSKVAMPVTLNEPLNALQLLCEELEYSNLLDKADSCDDKYEQMVYVAAFAVSAYGSTNTRAGQKPFNPILGETFECIRDDRGFRFVAEQVSHHPPISACHCRGETFEFWQDIRFKNKFWGKSMEIFPVGSVRLQLKKHGREFHWKKVTSCVHNIMAGTRWIEHYGDMVVTCGGDTCKVTFSKSGYWSSKNGEINGSVIDSNDETRYKLHGKWFEGIFCDIDGKTKTIWRPNPMPPDYEQQYGFTRFAIELNELMPDLASVLPRTDTRFRPDQRCLENGDVSGAEEEKVRVEQLQREQKKQRDVKNVQYQPLFFTKLNGNSDDEGWSFKGNYWKLRQDPGFKNFEKLPVLW